MKYAATGVSSLLFPDNTRPEQRIIGYLPSCYPRFELYREALRRIRRSGIRVLEIGIPGGVGDLEGGTISEALMMVEKNGIDPETAIRYGVGTAAEEGLLPVVMAFRATVVEGLGVESFVRCAAESGARAILVPDLDPGEMDHLAETAERFQLPVVQFVAAAGAFPQSIANTAFFYLQTADMPTGGVFSPDENVRSRIAGMKDRFPDLPVALGFGIRTPQHVREAFGIGADLVIIGTAMVDALNRGVEYLGEYANEIVAAAGGTE
jgi:tryptophan synthase alpha chain